MKWNAAMALRTGALPVHMACSPLPGRRYFFKVFPPTEIVLGDTELSIT
jgi:hypothetical protein